ncbi:MAG TPA: CsbD family protein [Polyangia bacterium]
MNKDQVKGGLKEAAGKVQEKTGELVGSKSQEAKGLAKEIAGKAQKNFGDAKQVVKDSGRKA